MEHLDHVTKEIPILDQTIRPQRPQVSHADLTFEECRRVSLLRGIDAVLIARRKLGIKGVLEVPAGLKVADDCHELTHGPGKGVIGTRAATALTL